MNFQPSQWMAIALPVTLIALMGSQPSVADPMQRQVEEVANYLIGKMETSTSLTARTDQPKVRMTTCKVRFRNGSQAAQSASIIFLYQEQARVDNLAQPYRQRLLQIRPSLDGQAVESATYNVLNPQVWINQCDQPEADRIVESNEIGEYHCSMFLHQVQTAYIGQTQAEGCPSNYRGAVRITNHVVLDDNGMETFDQGFDQEGNQVWGAENQPYQYQRIQ
ncbi:MAG: chromophore lyase CpcT/CpeT [Microcoleaceae cyanobacterium]